MLKNFLIIVCLALSPLACAKEIKVKVDEGKLTLADFLDACSDAATCNPSKEVPLGISGQKIIIKGVPYQVRYFSFEDPSGKLSPDMTFHGYATKNNLLQMKSSATNPLPGIRFESFDFRQSPAKDGVYFSMALREIDN
ncbi:MAG: hypothetical protein FJX71_03105 [Alphaproteobacteria bacterium]|nr:hypothetical protein [Alphaproteobacteria bacterium]